MSSKKEIRELHAMVNFLKALGYNIEWLHKNEAIKILEQLKIQLNNFENIKPTV